MQIYEEFDYLQSTELLEIAIRTAKYAGKQILTLYRKELSVEIKHDGSPLTVADQKSNDVIIKILEKTGIPIISEEKAESETSANCYWIVDPLDGTKDFLACNDEFTVNVALIQNNYPVLGVVYAPALDLLYSGLQKSGAWCHKNGERIPCVIKQKRQESRMTVSRFHDHPDVHYFAEKNGIINIKRIGSALKFGCIAMSEAEVYPRLVGTSEWDTAAGQAILEAVGGSVVDWAKGLRLIYGKAGRRNPRFIAFRNPYKYSDFQLSDYSDELL